MRVRIILILICAVFVCQGCVFYRHDTEAGRDSITMWTAFKDFNITVDPDGIKYESDSKNAKVVSPYGVVETTD